MTGEWLAFCNACPVPEIANVFTRTGIKFQQVTGMLHDPACWKEISGWVEAAAVANIMQNNRLGCMGHYYSGMLDIYTDLTEQYAYFGGHIELLEVEELAALRKQVTIEAVKGRLKLLLKHLMCSLIARQVNWKKLPSLLSPLINSLNNTSSVPWLIITKAQVIKKMKKLSAQLSLVTQCLLQEAFLSQGNTR